MKLQRRVAIVTGGSRGIGRAIAVEFAREGALVTLAARSEEELQETVQQVREAGSEALVLKTDLINVEEIESMVSATQKTFGPVDILVNNAGIA